MDGANITTIYAMSNGSLDMCPNNTPEQFVNILKKPITLDPNLKYMVKLHGLHVPVHETSLIKDDFKDSSITYNIGIFIKDKGNKYSVDKQTVKELFKLAPNRNVDGIFSEAESKYFEYQSDSLNNDTFRDITGKPSGRTLKEQFISELGQCLKLNTKLNAKRQQIEKVNLDLLKKHLELSETYRSEVDLSDNNNLLARFFSDLNYLVFNEFSFLTQNQLMLLMSKIMYNLDFNNETYQDIIKKVAQIGHGPIANSVPHILHAALKDPRATNDISDEDAFVSHIRNLQNQCPSLDPYVSFPEDKLRKIHRKDTTREQLIQLAENTCPTHLKKKIKKKINKKRKFNNNNRQLEHILLGTGEPTLMTYIDEGSNDNMNQEGQPSWVTNLHQQAANATNNVNMLADQPQEMPTNDVNMLADQPQEETNEQLSGVQVGKDQPFLGLFCQFGKRMSRFLNVKDGQFVLLAHFGFPTAKLTDYYLKFTPNFTKPKLDKIMVYSDLVTPSIQVGGTLSNLLDIISTPNANTIHRPHLSPSYKPLRRHTIEEVSIISTNIDGGRLHFENGAQTSYELHIAPLNDI